ncbi:gnk2-like domain-containing protein [Artemisia annua]|uniref:Gnk2-like domain-containing protein n=1 Tax=Artemisia annua TaxID=35608 RepID=A0A2U1L7K7_ARTAN|nr:gnk2-like domain-containing protein [Artemisia annua]
MMKFMLFIALFLIKLGSSHCQCSNSSAEFKTNLRTLLDLLSKNAPLHDGFYNASVGNKPDQVFGILHCRANISRNDCANCYRHPIGVSDYCPMKNEREIFSNTCTMKYSEENSFGIWSLSSVTTFGNNGLDDPLVYSKGFSMMQDIARTVPDQTLMYQAAEIDVGVNGKRYGLAQCGRDLSKLNCQNCLEKRLEANLRSYTENRTGWEILGVGCSMWYSNVSLGVTPLPPPQSRVPPGEPSVSSGKLLLPYSVF